MAARLPVPSETRLTGLIREAYEALPGPDSRRMTEIGIRLAGQLPKGRTRGLRSLPWWLLPLLLAGAAAAAWWASEQWFYRPTVEHEPAITTAPGIDRDQPGETDTDIESRSKADETATPVSPEQRRRIIYQREAQ